MKPLTEKEIATLKTTLKTLINVPDLSDYFTQMTEGLEEAFPAITAEHPPVVRDKTPKYLFVQIDNDGDVWEISTSHDLTIVHDVLHTHINPNRKA